MKHRLWRAAAVACATAYGICALTGCTDSQQTGAIIVTDSSLRALETDCAGAGAYLPFHAGAELRISDDLGTSVLTTSLSPGTAIAADTKDYGVAKRVPSYCAFNFDSSALTPGEKYFYSIDGELLGDFIHQLEGDSSAPVSHPPLGDPSAALKDSMK